MNPFTNKYNLIMKNFSSGKDDWKKIRKIIQQLLVMCYMLKNEYMLFLHFKTQLNHENQIVIFMIANGKG